MCLDAGTPGYRIVVNWPWVERRSRLNTKRPPWHNEQPCALHASLVPRPSAPPVPPHALPAAAVSVRFKCHADAAGDYAVAGVFCCVRRRDLNLARHRLTRVFSFWKFPVCLRWRQWCLCECTQFCCCADDQVGLCKIIFVLDEKVSMQFLWACSNGKLCLFCQLNCNLYRLPTFFIWT